MRQNEHPVQPQIERLTFDVSDVPWQLWIVILLLSLEGLGNFLSIPSQPLAIFWLGSKILFVWGFVRRWRVVFVLFCVVAAIHVLAFSVAAPFVAFLNLVTLILMASQFRLFFPTKHLRANDGQCAA